MGSSSKKAPKNRPSKSDLKEKILKNEEKLANFQSVFTIYRALYDLYRKRPAEVPKETWQNKVISALTAQPILNLPKKKEILYSGLISTTANKIVKERGGLTKARKGTGNAAITNEHYYPRKYVAKKILELNEPLDFEDFVETWWSKMGVYHITTKAENSELRKYIEENLKHNKKFDPLKWKDVYEECKVDLIPDPNFVVLED